MFDVLASFFATIDCSLESFLCLFNPSMVICARDDVKCDIRDEFIRLIQWIFSDPNKRHHESTASWLNWLNIWWRNATVHNMHPNNEFVDISDNGCLGKGHIYYNVIMTTRDSKSLWLFPSYRFRSDIYLANVPSNSISFLCFVNLLIFPP